MWRRLKQIPILPPRTRVGGKSLTASHILHCTSERCMPGCLEVLGKLKVGCPGGACQYCPPWTMAAERPRMAARDCKWRYRSMVQLCHLPRRQMQLLSTPLQKSAMAPVEWRQPALTSSVPIPNSSPCARAADLKAFEMSLLLMYHRRPEGIYRYVPNGASWGSASRCR